MLFVVLAIAGGTATGVGAERRYGARAGAAARRILRVMLYGLLPPVIFVNIAHLQLTGDAGAGVGLGIVALGLTGAIAYLVSRRGLGLSRATTGSVVNASIHGNTSYLGFPVVAAVLGPEHLGEAILYDTLVQGPVFFLGCFGVATALGTEAGGTVGRARAGVPAAQPAALRRACSGSSPRPRSRPTCWWTPAACSSTRCCRSASSPSG